MKRSNKIAAVVIASLGLGLAVAGAHANPGSMGGMHGGMGAGMAGHGSGPMAGQQLMTPEERNAMHEKMRSAATPEERQKIAEANRAEMQKRAKEKGITLPEMHGAGHGMGPKAEQHKH